MPTSTIYLDNNSTTPIDPRVLEAMTRVWRDCGANPASQHSLGRKARRILEDAREGILELLGAKTGGMDADQLVFTSGGTEANNLILFGFASLFETADVLISPYEHPSILTAAKTLRHVKVTTVSSTDKLREQLGQTSYDARGLLVSHMLANNETGIIYPIRDIALLGESHGVHFHSDAVQAVGKIPIHFGELGVDALTLAPHKFHGPLGIGGLVLKHGTELQPRLFGGFQQAALRPGTENVALAVGFHEALKLAVSELSDRSVRMQTLRDQLENDLLMYGRQDEWPTMIVGGNAPRLPNTSCVSFPGLDRQALVIALDLASVACSTGSACASGSSEPSPTLVGMGLPNDVIKGAIRISLSAFTTAEDVAEAGRRIVNTVRHLRTQK